MRNYRAVVPKIKVQDAIKQVMNSSKEEYVIGKKEIIYFLLKLLKHLI